jgi:MerR family transcriptional regulator, copper efflux regulator
METDQNSELQPIACTLSGSGQGQRVGEWQNLLAHGTAREPVPDGIRVTLPATLAGPAAELAAAEQQCCPFFRFTLLFDGGDIQLTMQAPPEAASLLTALTDDSAPAASSYPA